MKAKLYNCYRACFPEDSKEYSAFYINSKFDGKNVYHYTDNDKIVTMAFLLKNTLDIGGKQISCPFFAAVGTIPEERKKGFARKLLLSAMRELREKGEIAVSLYPEKEAFYAPLGFVTYAYSSKYSVKEPAVEAEEQLNESNAAEMVEVYNEYSKKFYVKEVIDEYEMKKKIGEFLLEGKVVGSRKNGKLVAYSMYFNDNEVDEVAYVDPFYIPRLSITNFRTPSNVGKNESMIRVINIVEFLKNINYEKEFKIDMKIKITDEVMPENNCVIRLKVEDGKSVVEKLDDNSPYDIDYLEPDLVSTILRSGKNLSVKKF